MQRGFPRCTAREHSRPREPGHQPGCPCASRPARCLPFRLHDPSRTSVHYIPQRMDGRMRRARAVA
eukprot:1777594-Prymnesium_polylepis.1